MSTTTRVGWAKRSSVIRSLLPASLYRIVVDVSTNRPAPATAALVTQEVVDGSFRDLYQIIARICDEPPTTVGT
jgi:hypothetical protein